MYDIGDDLSIKAHEGHIFVHFVDEGEVESAWIVSRMLSFELRQLIKEDLSRQIEYVRIAKGQGNEIRDLMRLFVVMLFEEEVDKVI